MNNNLSKQFRFPALLRFALPSIIMMVFMSLYTMVDGIFVSRLLNTEALSAVNIVYPLISVIIAIGIMLATGASAVIAKKMGEDKKREAKENFTFIIAFAIGLGICITILSLVFLEPMLYFLRAEGTVYPLCYDYAYMLIWFITPALLQMLFQTFFVTAGRPALGLTVTVLGGIANIVLDYLFIAKLNMGIAGASVATGIGYSIPAVFGLIYFSVYRKGSLHFVKPKWDKRLLPQACLNGSSEMVSNLATALTTYLFNVVMMNMLGIDGVAAITIVLYAQYFLTAVYLGYSIGVAPIFSYNYGNQNKMQLKRLFKMSMAFLLVVSLFTFAISFLLAPWIVKVFAAGSDSVYQIALHGFYLFSFCYLFMGVNIFASSMFTALSDGKTSAMISFMRTFLFLVAGIALLPKVWGIDGVWLAVPLAELLTLFLAVWGLKSRFWNSLDTMGKQTGKDENLQVSIPEKIS